MSLRDVVALSKEGVSDAVLVALIETDGSHFTLSGQDVRTLRASGVSDAVIIAMIKSRVPLPVVMTPVVYREAATPSGPVAPAGSPTPTQGVVLAPTPQAPAAPAPVVVVEQTVTQTVEAPRHVRQEPVYVPVYVPVAVPRADKRPEPDKKEEPVYWGFGGKLRPDAWGQKKQ